MPYLYVGIGLAIAVISVMAAFLYRGKVRGLELLAERKVAEADKVKQEAQALADTRN